MPTVVCASCHQDKPLDKFPSIHRRQVYNWDRTVVQVKPKPPKCVDCRQLRSRKSHAQTAYGLTPVAFDTLRTKAKNCCMICTRPFQNLNFCVDHDHATGQVRGLLCDSCNWGLGHFKDNVKTLKTAIKYLEATAS